MPIELEWLENGGSQDQDILVLWFGDSYIEAKWIFVILFVALCVVLFIYVKIRDARTIDDTEDIDDEDDEEVELLKALDHSSRTSAQLKRIDTNNPNIKIVTTRDTGV